MSQPLQSTINNQPLIGGGQVATVGTMFFVSSTASGASNDAAHGLDPVTPFATLAYALGKCSNNNGDTIFVAAGHSELVQTAGGESFNAKGVHVIGLGTGRSRPLFQFASSTSASVRILQENCTIENCQFQMTVVNALVAGISVEAADTTFRNCELVLSDTLGTAVAGLVTTTAASRLRLEDCQLVGIATAGTTAFMELVGTPDRVTLERCTFLGQASQALLWNDTGNVATNLQVSDCRFETFAGSAAITLTSAVTGLIEDVSIASSSLATALTPGSCACDRVFGSDTSQTNIQAIPLPIQGSILATTRNLADELVGASLNAGRLQSFTVNVDFSSATWNTIAQHRVLTVSGQVRLRLIPLCGATLVDDGSNTGTIQLGTVADTTIFIGATTSTGIHTGMYWLTTGPEARQLYGQIIDVILSDQNVGFELATKALTAGTLNFLVWYEAISAGGSVTAGNGGAL